MLQKRIMRIACIVLVMVRPLCADTNKVQAKLWSILICTLEERKKSFDTLRAKVQRQIEVNQLNDQVEILFFRDNRERSIGYKRNFLLQQSKAEYVSFLDDDDDVHGRYVPMIYEKLQQKPDCVSLVGIMTTHGKNPEIFKHSIAYNNKYCTEDGVHFRPPNHLNPIKRDIAAQFSFPEANYGEDYSWAHLLAESALLKTEAVIEEPYYFYLYDGKYHGSSDHCKKPRVSIITSVYKGDEFIEGFLADIVRQTIFKECELIIINANSPGNEEPIIKQYCEQYPNIIYERLEADPGLYAVWNYGIKKARADLVTNANIDDRRNPESIEMHARALEEDGTIDLVYSDFYNTYKPNETFENNTHAYLIQPGEFTAKGMNLCVCGPFPMWRTLLHDRYGFFDEQYVSAGDYEYWNRLAAAGVYFKHVPGISGLYFENPTGLSTDQDARKVAQRNYENNLVVQKYRHLWDC
ncbi:MAG TPA: glycosyltransferase [Candidatus Babeliales bacterium]|nr:glycosyltransferase [Candidatus Babeliales bacterium]